MGTDLIVCSRGAPASMVYSRRRSEEPRGREREGGKGGRTVGGGMAKRSSDLTSERSLE